MRPAGGWFDSSPKHYDYPYPACFPLAMTIANEVSQAPHPWGDSPGENHGDEHHGGHAYEACRTPLRRWGSRCTRYAPPPAVHTWSPPAHCATSAGKPRTSAALAAAIHTPRKPIGSHEPVCWRGIRDASALATDQTDAAGTMACAAPPAPSPTIGRSNASSLSKPDWTLTIRSACAACASVATTARRQGRNLQASTDEAFADSSHLLHTCGTSSQADDVRRAPQA